MRKVIYLFYDSRGRSIYAGKTEEQSLWSEMTNAFNRRRGEVQKIKRVKHPVRNVQFRGAEEKRRLIVDRPVLLRDLAHYFSAYSVPEGLIGKLEALIVRAFANDLLNIKMENF